MEVIANGLMTIGLARLVGNEFAFLNFGRSLLLSDVPPLLPPRRVVLEIPEAIGADEAVIERCRDLKKLGFQIAIDGVSEPEQIRALARLTDFVKVDVRRASAPAQERIAAALKASQTRLIAEKVEARAEFDRSKALGYSLFQGYYFEPPVVITGNRVSPQQSTYMQLVRELVQQDLDFARLERLFKHDPTMTYRLLRYLNSALFSWASPIRSIRQALSLLGEEELRRWLGLLAFTRLAPGRPTALVVRAAARGRFCELLGGHSGLESRSAELFLLGLLSIFDLLLNCPMEGVVEGLGLSTDVAEALLGLGDKSSRLSRVFHTTVAWDQGDWDEVMRLSASLHIDSEDLAETCAEAMEWSDRVSSVTCPGQPVPAGIEAW